MRTLSIATESWPIAGRFVIARGAKTEARVVHVLIEDGEAHGQGECVPYLRYGETPERVAAQIESQRDAIEHGMSREDLQRALPPGAARNALDCALWDLEAKRAGLPVHQIAGLPAPTPRITAFTLSIDTPEAMADAAARAKDRPLLKIKLNRDGVLERMRAVRKGAPDARLIVDANEAWTPALLADLAGPLADLGVVLIEQPLPAHADEALADFRSPVPLCADESVHGLASLDALARGYAAVNVKLDKTGGLTEALAVKAEAAARGLSVMVGCMVGTSLAMAPAFLLTHDAAFVDLDGPLMLARDRTPSIRYEESLMHPPAPELWG